MNTDILSAAKYWADHDVFDAQTRGEIQDLLERQDHKELEERFYRDLEFGTGGLRGILGAGANRMNRYNVRRAAYALAQYVKSYFSEESQWRIVISFDSRQYSDVFAKEAASVFAAAGITAFITEELRPVPMLSYMVRHYQCHAGVCITASHNPPEYNGFKVYWQTGGQVVPPHDQGIIAQYLQHNRIEEIPTMSFDRAVAQERVQVIGQDLDEAYYQAVSQLRSLQEQHQTNIVYTALHGTGLKPVTEVLRRFGFENVHLVAEQSQPDGRFPTVSSPNPESQEALAMAVAYAKQVDADLVMGTDPDADRIGVVHKHDGQYVFLNGNQLGSLLVDYVLQRQSQLGVLPANPLVVKTIVTTDLQDDIAKHYGASCEETLTGFKWICALIEDYQNGVKSPRKNYVCGGEESYGFLAGSFVRDKDAVAACALAAEMTAFYQSQGLSLFQALLNIMSRHGLYYEDLATVTLPGKDGVTKIAAIMQQMREQPPRQILGTAVESYRDFSIGQIFTRTATGFEADGTLQLPRSNVLQFILADGTKLSMRPSGTEPKMKYYISLKAPVQSSSHQEMEAQLKALASQAQSMLQSLKAGQAG